MNEMKAKGIQNKKDEEVRFSKFSQWCDNINRQKTNSIAEAAEQIEALEADILKAETEVTTLSEAIHEAEQDIDRWAKDTQAVSEIQSKREADYRATHADYSGSVDALERALNVLKKMPESVPQSLLQVSLKRVGEDKLVPQAARSAVLALLEQHQDPEATYSAPEANAYESKSGGVIEMLEELRQKFRGEVRDLEKEEMEARAAAELVLQKLKDQTELAEQSVERKTKKRAENQEFIASAKGDLDVAQKAKAEDEKYLSDLKAECAQKSFDFEKRQELRAGEIEALSKAIEIIGGAAVAGKDTRAAASASLVQLRSVKSRNPSLEKAAEFLKIAAEKTKSKTLAMVAQKAEEDPFAKVKKMIRDLIVKLMEEANSEAEHKGWCDTELATNKQTRDIKTEAVDKLTSEVEKLNADISKLAMQIGDLMDSISEIDAALAKATEQRQAEKEKNAATVGDAKEGQEALTQAMAVLKEFYAKAAEATSLAQGPADDAPETFDSAYQGQQDQAGSVMGFLEVILSDFARLEGDTEAAEAQAQDEYEGFVADSDQDKAVKNAEIEHKESKKKDAQQALIMTKRSLAEVQAELDAALKYYDELKPSCVDQGVSYEERVAARKEEIQSLKEAYEMLGGDAPEGGGGGPSKGLYEMAR